MQQEEKSLTGLSVPQVELEGAAGLEGAQGTSAQNVASDKKMEGQVDVWMKKEKKMHNKFLKLQKTQTENIDSFFFITSF